MYKPDPNHAGWAKCEPEKSTNVKGCLICGTLFKKRPTESKDRWAKRICCSPKCRHMYLRQNRLGFYFNNHKP